MSTVNSFSNTGLSLRGGGQRFPPATRNVAPGDSPETGMATIILRECLISSQLFTGPNKEVLSTFP